MRRATRSERQNRHCRLLTCTSRYQPVRMICARARASLRSRLVRHCLHRCIGLTGFDADRRQPGMPQPFVIMHSHAVREASKPMRSSGRPRSLQSRYQRVRLAGRSKLFHDAARLIDHADRGLFQRHIQSSKVSHGCSFPMLVAVRQPTTPIIPMEQPLLSPSPRPQSPHLTQKSPRQSLSATTASETDSSRSALVCPKIPSAGWRRMDSRLLLHWSDVAQRRRLSCGNCLRCANEGSRLPKQGVCFASSSDSAVGRPGGA